MRLHTLEANGVKWAKRAGKMIDNYDKLITTVLIGNNIVNIVLTSLATVFFVALMTNQQTAVTVSTVVVTATVLVFGEITPKTIAKEHPEGFVRAVNGVVWLLEILFFPLTWIFSQWRKLMLLIFK